MYFPVQIEIESDHVIFLGFFFSNTLVLYILELVIAPPWLYRLLLRARSFLLPIIVERPGFDKECDDDTGGGGGMCITLGYGGKLQDDAVLGFTLWT